MQNNSQFSQYPSVHIIGTFLFLLSAFFACSLPKVDEMPDPISSPVARFSVNAASGPAPLNVSITNNSLNATKFSWTFGDGGSSTDRDPLSHSYTNVGTYSLRLEARNDDNVTDDTTIVITVISPTALPNADFTFTNDGCTAGCSIPFTSTSNNAATLSWNFGDPASGAANTSTLPNPSHTFSAAGTYSVKLKVQNGALLDSITKTVTINAAAVVKFSKAINLSDLNVTPYNAVQTSEGKFHLLYNQNGIKSVLISGAGDMEGAVVPHALDMAVNKTLQYNGGFILSGEKSSAVYVALINQQMTKTMGASLQFNGNPSNGQGLIVNGNSEIAVTGLRQQPSPIFPGFATLSLSGTPTATPVINNAGLEDFGGISIAQKTTGDYFITANYLNPPGGAASVLLSVASSGAYNAKFSLDPLTSASKIIRLSGNTFAVIGKNGAGEVYALGINSSGGIAWQRPLAITNVSDVLFSDDQQLVICGTKSGALYWAKFAPVSGTTYLWERSISGTNGSITGVSIAKTTDGGYLILGKYDNAGKTEPFLVKTDNMGLAQ